MGDRCRLSVRVRTDQIELFCKASGLCEPDFFEIDYDGKTANAELEEVNYGGYRELLEAAQQGVVFVGEHGAGDEYGPARFAGVRKLYHECDTDFGGGLALPACDDGTVAVPDLKELKKFVAHYQRAEKALDAKNPPKPKQKKVKS